jgi:hypothetical protein
MTKDTRNTYTSHPGQGRHYSHPRHRRRGTLIPAASIGACIFFGIILGVLIGFALGYAVSQIAGFIQAMEPGG